MKKIIHTNYFLAFSLFLLTFFTYLLSNYGRGTDYNYFVLLADAFLHGRLYLLEGASWLNELVIFNGFYFVVFPPLPALLLLPAVAVFGTYFPQPLLSIFLGSINVALAFFVILRVFNKKDLAVWISLLYGFGTIQWFHAEVGSAWYVAHIVALFFIWLMILESITKKRTFIIGLLIGAAYLSRIPTILSVIFIVFFLHEKLFPRNKKFSIDLKQVFFIASGILPFLCINFLYNYARYGVFFDIGYIMLPIHSEPWYQYGFVNIKYIPIHLKEIFFAMPKFIQEPPFVIPNLFAMAIWVITPAYFLMFFANFKEKICIASLIAIIFIAIPELMHGGNGFSQFGYRHTLDFLPFILILVASGFKNKFYWWGGLLIGLSILINFWGVIMVSFLDKWVI
jgi:hypothetical protein